jgi:hypothetical protein
MRAPRIAVVVVAGLLAAAAVACGTASAEQTVDTGYVPTPASSASGAAGQAAAPASPRVARLLDGFPLWIENGASTSVGASLNAAVSVRPYPPAREGVLDLVLSNSNDGSPIEGATIETVARMRYMDHGVYRAVAEKSIEEAATAGSYRAQLRLPMPGEWVVTVHVSNGTLSEEFDLLVAVNQ